MKSIQIIIKITTIFLTSLSVYGQPMQHIFTDDFDGPSLDKKWSLEFDSCIPEEPGNICWDYSLANSELRVFDIFEDNPSGAQSWRTANLVLDVPPLSDFNIVADVDWYNPSNGINHVLHVILLDSAGVEIGFYGYVDRWPGAVGAPHGYPCNDYSNACQLPFGAAGTEGPGQFTLSRSGNELTFAWISNKDESNEFFETETTPLIPPWSSDRLSKVIVSIQHFDKFNTGTGSTIPFGEVAIDRISVHGVVGVPELLSALIASVIDLN